MVSVGASSRRRRRSVSRPAASSGLGVSRGGGPRTKGRCVGPPAGHVAPFEDVVHRRSSSGASWVFAAADSRYLSAGVRDGGVEAEEEQEEEEQDNTTSC